MHALGGESGTAGNSWLLSEPCADGQKLDRLCLRELLKEDLGLLTLLLRLLLWFVETGRSPVRGGELVGLIGGMRPVVGATVYLTSAVAVDLKSAAVSGGSLGCVALVNS